MRRNRVFPALLAGVTSLVTADRGAQAQVFEPTAGSHVWNNDNNWGPGPPQPYPNGVGATATISAPTDHLTIDLGQTITLSALTITKSQSAAFDTTITATAPNGFVFDGGGTISTLPSYDLGGGASIIAAPVSFNGPLTITQGDDQILRFTGSLSGSGSVNVNRTGDGEQFVAFNAANSYGGATTVTGNGTTVFAVLRLNHADAIPGGLGASGGASNITLTNSAILGLGSTDFTRSIGAGPDQIQFLTPVNSGFAAFGGTRVVNLGGAQASVAWANAGFGTLTFGSPTSDGTVDFQNPLNLGNANRTVRAVDGTAPIDGKLSGGMTSTGGANNFTKTGGGTLSLAGPSTYTGNTIINGGALRIDHPQSLPANSNVSLSGGGVLGLGVADYAATIGTAAGQVQFGTGNAGFAAYNGDRKVTLNGGAPLTWGVGSLNVAGGLILSDDGADGLLEFTNALDLGASDRTLIGRSGAAPIDARLTGVLSGAGGIIKTTAGTLELAAANTYTGVTRVNGGVLLLTNANSIPGGTAGASTGNITLGGGVLGLGAGDFTAPLGVGPGQVQWAAPENGGFAAFGGNRVVNIGGANAPLTWGVDGFATANLILSWAGSDGRVEFTNPINLNGAVRTFAGRDGTQAVDSRVSGVISGPGGVIKTQPGTLEFTAANTYDGDTTVEAGRLLANNTSGSAFGGGNVIVTAAGTLGGVGFVGTVADESNITVQADGRLAPGTSIGKLSVAGNATWEAGSFFDLDLGGNAAGQFDQLAIDGIATLSGSLAIHLLNGYVPAAGTSLEVLTATGGVTGSFAPPSPSNGVAWDIVYGTDDVTLVARFAADFNNDGDVDVVDLNAWKTNAGLATGATRSQGDADGDGDVDGSDFLTWQRSVGLASTTAASATVPEPTGIVLLALHVVGMLVRRRSTGAQLRTL
jgi:autotransporter-associated beta strand protein